MTSNELADNALDAKATRFEVDTDQIITRGRPALRYLSFQDDGIGMTPVQLHKMMSFGMCSKTELDMGTYGNGFKSGSMRIGSDALVFTKTANQRSLGFLSQTFLGLIGAEEVLVPMVHWNLNMKLYSNEEEDISAEQSKQSYNTILANSCFKLEQDIIAQFNYIKSTGTRIVIYNLTQYSPDVYEFSFKNPHDIELDSEKKKESNTPCDEFSLRAYFQILYLNPRMRMYIRGQKVLTQRIVYSLWNPKEYTYRPQIKDGTINRPEARGIVGYTRDNMDHHGIMYYHKGRLIQRYVKLGMLNTSRGHGVVVILDCPFLTPNHNKQDFTASDRYHNLQEAIKDKISRYIQTVEKIYGDRDNISAEIRKDKNRTYWVQCDMCLKWRSVPKPNTQYSHTWCCPDNLDHKFSNCNIDQEVEKPFPDLLKYEAPMVPVRKASVPSPEQDDEEEVDSQDPPYSNVRTVEVPRTSPVSKKLQPLPAVSTPNISKKRTTTNSSKTVNYKHKLNDGSEDDDYNPTNNKEPDDDIDYEELSPIRNKRESLRVREREKRTTEVPTKRKSDTSDREIMLCSRLEEIYHMFKKHTKKIPDSDLKDPNFWMNGFSPLAHYKPIKQVMDKEKEKDTEEEGEYIRNTTSLKRKKNHLSQAPSQPPVIEKKIKKEPAYSAPTPTNENSRKTDHSDFFEALFQCK